jgi:hypothetical protein
MTIREIMGSALLKNLVEKGYWKKQEIAFKYVR